jgi:hypothetical protein
MNSRATPPPSPSAAAPRAGRDAAAADHALRVALRDLPPAVDPPVLAALQERVLAQWREQVGNVAVARPGAAAHSTPGGASSAGVLGLVGGRPGGGWGRGLAIALTGLAVVAALWWWQRPDPVLEELMRIDVLSQMAAGQM